MTWRSSRSLSQTCASVDKSLPTKMRRRLLHYNVTDSLNLVSRLIARLPRITTNLEHNSVSAVNTCSRFEPSKPIPFKLRGIHRTDEVSGHPANTKALIVNHGSNVIGTVQPLREWGVLREQTSSSSSIRRKPLA